MCGENAQGLDNIHIVRGSSPRVRGKPSFRMKLEPTPRLIPACAGKTRPLPPSAPSPGAHPRVCGENQFACSTPMEVEGSSPRVRGKLLRELRFRGYGGLIPACAGKTATSTWESRTPEAHPRVCGENTLLHSWTAQNSGSSPRVRGKLKPEIRCDPLRRLIPACAGKTMKTWYSWAVAAAHPRVCGENGKWHPLESLAVGSSPRVRGKPEFLRDFTLHAGLIPACAGKTSDPPISPLSHRAHPRVCGENILIYPSSGLATGSSPRVRGKRFRRVLAPGRVRLIPACAGKTLVGAHGGAGTSAHPRVCGENSG